ncbi:MAG: peptidase [Alphaproteobacteria bacterium]|nr:peptidase [Alphaproteobacteria bacterium]
MRQLSNAAFEQALKWLAVILGFFSAISVVQGWQLAAMVISLPFCLIWVYCGWLRTEPQLKYLNIMFSLLYAYGIGRYFFLNA